VRENLYDGLRDPQQIEERPLDSETPRLIFVAPKQTIYQCLCGALQDHFREVEVFLVDRIDDGLGPDNNVRLVLLGAGARSIGPSFVEQCRVRFPKAAIAVAIDSGRPVVDPLVVEHRLIQGLLPTTLPLDVWFALMRLVMAGGEYLPRESQSAGGHFEAQQRLSPPPGPVDKAPTPPAPRANGAQSAVRDQGNETSAESGLDSLTAREREILTLVSEGYQNKLIADRMALSEHTVKAHVHNLIAKLRVTNRTQAAAYLHEHRSERGGAVTGQDHRRRAYPG